MKPEHAALLKSLFETRPVAALGTLHEGRPLVSMVPFVVVRAGAGVGFVIHVSGLSAHTRDMEADSRVSLMIMENEDEAETPLALARVSLECDAVRVDDESPERATLARAYVAKFPDAEPLLHFPDFRFFLLVPRSARFVAGFGQAMTVGGEALSGMIHE